MTDITPLTWFVLDVNPEPWAIGSLGMGRKNGRMYPYVGQNAQLDSYKKAVREALGKQELIEGDLHVVFFFWRNLAEYKTQSGRKHTKHHADATNMQKATEDALQGVLFDNDKSVVNVQSVVMAQGPDVRGKVAVGIRPTSPEETRMWLAIMPDDILDDLENMDTYKAPKSDLDWGDGDDLF